jgi:hypothetical protein
VKEDIFETLVIATLLDQELRIKRIRDVLNDYEKEIDAFANFRTIGISLFRIYSMFIGELESDKFEDPLWMTMLVLFIFFMTITLQNLMNSMALIDTQEVLNEAEIISLKKRVSIVRLFGYKFDLFSKTKLNRFILTPKSGNSLVFSDPLGDSKIENEKKN